MDISIADQLEFESWPLEQQQLARRYLEDETFSSDKLIQEAYSQGYENGYRAGSRRREANGTDN